MTNESLHLTNTSEFGSRDFFEQKEGRDEVVFPPGTEVFQELASLSGPRKPAESIVGGVRNRGIRRIVIAGGAGNGKTTVLDQCYATLEANQHRPLAVHYYDNFLTGKDDDTPEFNEKIFLQVKESEKSNPDGIDLVELVGIGSQQPKDRGVSALHMLAQDSIDNGNNTFFIVLAGSNAIELRSGFLRGMIRSMRNNPEDVIPFLNSHNVVPIGFGEGTEGGRRVWRYMAGMGQGEDIKKIRAEEENLLEEWRTLMPEVYERMLAEVNGRKIQETKEIKKVFDEFGIAFKNDQEARGYANLKIKGSSVKDRAAYSAWRLLNRGVSSSNIFVVHNPLRTQEIFMVNPSLRRAA